ncbi:flagellar basal body FlgE domain-containing protein, partial [Proteus mirabilis]|uniref:flagellar basal body FlgE domain-containing protein n=1 Tax=Proteus mirabilis TaxID=584 RepID=UPI00313E7640
YDSLGNEHNLNLFFDKTKDNEWSVYAQDTTTDETAQYMGKLVYKDNGVLDETSPNLKNFTTVSYKGSQTMDREMNFSCSTQQKVAESSVSKLAQN